MIRAVLAKCRWVIRLISDGDSCALHTNFGCLSRIEAPGGGGRRPASLAGPMPGVEGDERMLEEEEIKREAVHCRRFLSYDCLHADWKIFYQMSPLSDG